jgi:S1-C subfamily serine protease
VIVSIAGRPVRNAEDVVRVVTEQLSPGQNVPITYVRGSTRHTVSVHLAARPANPG